jgi:hypothetical protein
MFIKIAPKVKVYVSEEHLAFIETHNEGYFRASELTPADSITAKHLADKAIFVRKKLDNDTQYALNRSIKLVPNDNKK